MSPRDIPANVCQFVFEHIDSVETLEILILARSHPQRTWSAEQLSHELRSTPQSVSSRLVTLVEKGLLAEEPPSSGSYIYRPPSPEIAQVVEALVEVYKVKKHKVYELIFSPVKKIRFFADAFMLGKPDKKEESDG